MNAVTQLFLESLSGVQLFPSNINFRKLWSWKRFEREWSDQADEIINQLHLLKSVPGQNFILMSSQEICN